MLRSALLAAIITVPVFASPPSLTYKVTLAVQVARQGRRSPYQSRVEAAIIDKLRERHDISIVNRSDDPDFEIRTVCAELPQLIACGLLVQEPLALRGVEIPTYEKELVERATIVDLQEILTQPLSMSDDLGKSIASEFIVGVLEPRIEAVDELYETLKRASNTGARVSSPAAK